MNFKEWIIAGMMSALVTASTGLCTESGTLALQESFTQLEKAIQTAKDSGSHSDSHAGSNWHELEHFQASLWRAMALDPSPLAAVPVKEVPKELFAVELNQDLRQQFAELKKSSLPKQAKAETEFNQYASTVEQVLKFREARQFPLARAIAKRGILDGDFKPLLQKVGSTKDTHSGAPQLSHIEEAVVSLKEQIYPKDAQKRDLFSNGNNFVWFTVVAFLGFFIGIFGQRIHPNFFQRFVDTIDSSVPTATTHSGGTNTLDYARWLKELEEILSRLKTSQVGHERRIEDLVQNSDKMAQQAIALASDARIKNEANLEFRMSALVKGLKSQIEQGQKLQAGDRIQINVMLEHCLKLCDAIEAGAIHYDRTRPIEPPSIKTA
jgi:hypothetical protein